MPVPSYLAAFANGLAAGALVLGALVVLIELISRIRGTGGLVR